MTGIPKRMFMRVDLPAPFSPTRAWISPSRTESETPFKTRFPSYSLTIERSSRAAGPLVVDIADKEEVGVALFLVVLAQRDRDARVLLHRRLHGGGILVVRLLLGSVDQKIRDRADREHHLGNRPGREVPGHVMLGDHPLVLGIDVREIACLVRRDGDAE